MTRGSVQVRGNGRQHIVEVVRHAAGKLTECFHALRLRPQYLCLLAQRYLTFKLGEGLDELETLCGQIGVTIEVASDQRVYCVGATMRGEV